MRNIEVNLLFSANTTQAVNNINQLGQLLNKISTSTTIGVDGGSIQKAVASARELQIQLEKAVNVETGKLNLSTLNRNLKESGQSLNTLAANLQGAGTTGQQAFIKLANAVSQAEVPMIRVNQRLKNFGTTLLNTVKWQLASNAIHAVSGMLSSAVSHAENLNTALNDIRIVTGYNVNTMAEFAEQAAKAAKELSTTTEEYSKASLIFYQQGLTGKDVTDRADVVTKLMKVTGQSAEVVSNQMTGIWNNFYDGSESLESYADKLTKLGASTASSTDEIATGLEKFAAVADTVGLSYDYAAASVAAVVAQTRQSAEIVGTSFKTIFARLQDLKLGETLDDGTTLGQYSENLAKIGVNIQTADGELKDMNVILEETAAKWEMLDRGQQVALAKGVAGIRQYNQFIALMDNWDFVKDNVELAENATGELTNQFDIWAESYEGAAARVKQAQYNLYENFINDEDVVKLNNLFADLINGIADAVDSFGGLGPMVITLVGLFSTTLFPIIINGFKNLGNVIGVWSGSTLTQITNMQQQMSQQMTETLNNNNNLNESTRAQIILSQKLLDVKQQLALASKSMTNEEKLQAESRMQVYESIQAQVQAILEKRAALENEIAMMKESLNLEISRSQKRSIVANGMFNQMVEDGADETKLGRQMNAATHNTETSLKNKITEATEKLKTADEAEKTVLEAQIKDLTEILDLKRHINAEANRDTVDMRVGKATGGMIDEDQSEAQKSYTDKMGANIAAQLGNEGAYAEGSLNVDASITNLENLYGVMAQYKTQLGEITAVSKDFETAQQAVNDAIKNGHANEIAEGYKKISPAIKSVKKAEDEYAKAKKELVKAETQYGKKSKEAAVARANMASASKNLTNAEKNLAKIQSSQSKAFQDVYKAQQPLINSREQVMAWAQSIDMSEDQVRQLDAAYDNFINTGDISSLETINNFIKDIGIASSNSIEGILALAENMRQLLVAAGYSPEQIDPLINKLRQLANSAPQASAGLKGTDAELEKLKQSLNFTGEGFGKLLGSIASFAGQLSMATSGFNSMISAFDAGNTPMQTMTSLLMGATMILPILSTAFKKLKTDKDKDTAATLRNLAATMAKAKADGTYTAATWLLNAALAVKAILEDKWVGLALVGVALGVAGAIAIYSKKQEKSNELTEKENELKEENAKKSKEQEESNRELLKSYNDLLKTYKETGEGKEDLDSAAQKLAEAYDIEGAALARLTGEYADYKKVADAAYKAHQKELKSRLDDERSALRGSSEKLLKTADNAELDSNGSKISGSNYLLTLDGYGADDTKAANFLKGNISNAFLQNGNGGQDGTDVHFEIENIAKNPEQLVALYDELNTAYQKMSEDSVMASSGVFKDLQTYLNAIRDDVEAAREHLSEVQKLQILIGENEVLKGVNTELQQVESLKEYVAWIDKVTQALKKEGKTQEEINTIIETFVTNSTNPAIDSLKYYHTALQEIKKEQNFGDTIDDYFNDLEDEDKERFLAINFDIYKTEESWNQQIEFLKNKAELEEIELQIDLVTNVEGLLKETGMTEDIWKEILNSGIKWGEEGIIAFTDFLNMTYAQQVEYLEKLRKIQNEQRKKLLREENAEREKILKQLLEQRSKTYDLEEYNQLTKEIERINGIIENNNFTIAIIDENEKNNLKELYSLIESMSKLTVGEYITEENYQTLVKYNAELAKYFQLTSQGYQLIGNPLDFHQALKQTVDLTVKKELEDNITKLNELQEEYKNNKYTGMEKVEAAGFKEDGTFDFDTYNEHYDLLGDPTKTKLNPDGQNIAYREKQNENKPKREGLELLQSGVIDFWTSEVKDNNRIDIYNEGATTYAKDREYLQGELDQLNGILEYYNIDDNNIAMAPMPETTTGLYTSYMALPGTVSLFKEQYKGLEPIIGMLEQEIAEGTDLGFDAQAVVDYIKGLGTAASVLDDDEEYQALLAEAKQIEDAGEQFANDRYLEVLQLIEEKEQQYALFLPTEYQVNEVLKSGQWIVAALSGLDEEAYQAYEAYATLMTNAAEEVATEINNQVEYANTELPNKIAQVKASIQQNFADLLDNVQTSKERDEIFGQYSILQGEDLDFSTETVTDEEGNETIKFKNPFVQSYLQAAHRAIEQEASEGLDLEEWDAYSKYLQDTLNLEEELGMSKKEAEEASEDVAAAVMKMNRGVETLNSNWEEWGDVLENSSKDSHEYMQALTKTKTALSDILDVSEEYITNDFVAQHLGLIKQAAEGSADAIDALGIELATSILKNSIDAEIGITIGDTTYIGDEIDNLMNDVANQISGAGLKLGQSIDTEPLFQTLKDVVDASEMTMEQANAFYRAMGFTPVYESVPISEAKTVPTTVTMHTREYTAWEDGNPTAWIDYDSVVSSDQVEVGRFETQISKLSTKTEDGQESDNANTKIQVPTTNIKSFTYTGGGAMNNFSSINKGGKNGSGGNKSKAKDSRKKKSDAVDRYKEINDSLEKTNRLMQKNSTLADGLWGKNRIDMLKENVKRMKEENKLLEEKIEKANEYLAEDRADLEATGVGFTFEDGYITNYTDVMNGLFAEYKSKWNEFSGGNEDAELSEEQKEVLDKMWEHIETVKTAYEKYESTLDEVQDLQQEQLEKALQIQQENFAVLQKELEIKLSINEDDLTTIEYYLSKMSDDFYSMAEVAALMIGDAYSGDENNPFGTHNGRESQGLNYIQQLGNYKKYEEDLEYQYHTTDPETGKTYINKEQYIEGLREVKQGYIDNLQALQELDTAMMSYYADTLRAGQEELAKYTSQMDRHNAVLEHYSSILDIIGKSKDFESMGVVLEAQAHTAENAVKVAEENYNMLRKQADQRKAEYEAELAAKGEDDPGVQMLKKQWLDAEEVVGEAQDDMMQKTEEWAQALKAVVENELEGLAKELEKAFTANFGNSFEAMNTQMERAKSLQEEYLTTTNQVYETNKLIRQSQQEIDKTTNSIAKRRLKDFINETEQLQNKNKLSKFELEIQQAKYDLLLAEIALEEAQNAKSTVRLQRDSEGNFGYVYTADQNAIADAEQKFADAQNSLYNIGLEGANDYTEKYQQTLQEFYDTMTELQTQYLNGEFETEAEYQAAMMEAQEFYYAKLQEYSELYGIAVAVDANIVRDAWSTEFQSMTQSSAQWQAAITTYLTGVEQAFGKWDAYVQQIRDKTIGPNLDALKDKTSAIKTASDEVTTSITKKGGLLDALESEYDKVAALTLGYSGMREEIQKTIEKYEGLVDAIDDAIEKESGYEDGDSSSKDGDSNENDSNSSNDSSGSDSLGSGGNTSSQFGSATWERGKAAYDKINAGVWGNGAARVSNGLAAGFTQDEINLGQYMINLVYPTYIKGQGKTWEEAKKLLGFDTGGYTGDWGGSYGKLAMLHKKELVLNAGDTDNFLAGMEMLDNIVKTIDLYSMNAQLGGILSSPSFGFNNRIEPIEQNVHIEAHFPEATDRNEITEAINTLVNQASQFVNRK